MKRDAQELGRPCIFRQDYLKVEQNNNVLDLRFEQEVRKYLKERAFLIRYADDFVAGFRYHADGARFYRMLPCRMKKFGLNLANEKIRKFMFNKFRKEESVTFEFLGFEYRWVTSRRGNDIIRLRTATGKQRRIIPEFKEWHKKKQNKRLCGFWVW